MILLEYFSLREIYGHQATKGHLSLEKGGISLTLWTISYSSYSPRCIQQPKYMWQLGLSRLRQN